MDLYGEIKANFGLKPFSTSQAAKHGFTPKALKKLVEETVLRQPARGVYRLYEAGVDQFEQYEEAFFLAGTPSAICLWSALEHYRLTTEISESPYIMVPWTKKTKNPNYKFFRVRKPCWDIGINKTKNSFWITTPERTIVDCIAHKGVIDTSVSIAALIKAEKKKLVTFESVLKIAADLGHQDKLYPVIEPLTVSRQMK